jgi:hypothetical protein
MIEVLRIVENPLTGIARNNLIVLADLLKYLGANTDLANFANIVSSG